MDEIQHESSNILKWFRSVTPINQPEDFELVREAFEIAVAEEVISSMNDREEIDKTGYEGKT
ncbi:MAG: hypothetical protein NVS3B14_02740 [Ktedonobacteraceae bacterium]